MMMTNKLGPKGPTYSKVHRDDLPNMEIFDNA